MPSQHPENRDIFAVAIAIIQKDIVGIENYLSNLQSRYPEMPSAAIGAKLAGIKTPEALEVLRQYSNWTLLLTTAVSEKTSSDSDFTLYKSQVRKATAIRSSVLRDIALEHCNDWISFPNTKKIPPQVFLPLLEKCRKWKANARKDSLDPALFVTVEEASEMIMVDLYFIQKLVANGNLNLLRQANQKVKIRKIEVEKFLKSYESVNSIASRLDVCRKKVVRILNKHNLIPIKVARSTRPTIYLRQDIDAIIITLARPKDRTSYRNLESISIPLGEVLAHCSIQEAAKILNISRLILRDYAHAGLFPTYRHASRRGCLMAKKDINCFHSKYVLPTELSQLIGTSGSVAIRTLTDLGHHTVLQTLLSDSREIHPTPMFFRSDVDTLCLRRDSISEEALTINQAARILKLSDRTIIHLISIGDISLDQRSKDLPWVSKSKVANFPNTHANGIQASKFCNIPVRILQSSLHLFGVSPVSSPLMSGGREVIYRLEDIRHFMGKDPIDRTINSHITSRSINEFILIDKILNRYTISKPNFTRVFIQTNLVKTVNIAKERFLAPEDFALIDEILKHNLTLPMADRLLNAHAYAQALVKDGRLSRAQNLPAELDSCTFVTRRSLRKFLETRPLRPDP